MTAFLYDQVVTTTPAAVRAPALRLVRDGDTVAARSASVTRGIDLASFFAGDPLLDGAARLLSIPLRHVYAALWRVGVLEVRA